MGLIATNQNLCFPKNTCESNGHQVFLKFFFTSSEKSSLKWVFYFGDFWGYQSRFHFTVARNSAADSQGQGHRGGRVDGYVLKRRTIGQTK